ncbi:hypothetical protein CBL_07431 [Carabus blaptoides fortunei]
MSSAESITNTYKDLRSLKTAKVRGRSTVTPDGLPGGRSLLFLRPLIQISQCGAHMAAGVYILVLVRASRQVVLASSSVHFSTSRLGDDAARSLAGFPPA